MEWAWVWDVTIRYDRAMPHPVYRWRRILLVESPAELRQVVLDARHDPRVVGYAYQRRRRLSGELPAQCPAGHTWAVRPAATPMYWHACDCGGHHALRCPPCDLWQLEPPRAAGCGPFDPADHPDWRWT